jgi:DNA-directed RNA polymerase specialized sigma subunit
MDCAAIMVSPAARQPRCRVCDGKRKKAKLPVVIVSPASRTTRVRCPAATQPDPLRRLPFGKAAKGPPSQGAQVSKRKAKNGKGGEYVQAVPTEIMRMVDALFVREERIKKAEDIVAHVQGQNRMAALRLKELPTTSNQRITQALKEDLEAASDKLVKTKAWRDFTAQKIRLYLDHALSTTPYQTKVCDDCKVPQPGTCKICNGVGTVKTLKTNYYAVAAAAKLKHIQRVLEVTELCAKVKAKTSEADAAYAKLLEHNIGLVRKFGAESQTGMEKDDAEQGAMIGLLDAAVRFNPAKPQQYECPRCKHTAPIPQCATCNGKGETDQGDCGPCRGWGVKAQTGGMPCGNCKLPRMGIKTSTADYGTYAYNWSYRNSRARKETDKRAGASSLGGKAMVSLDGMSVGKGDEKESVDQLVVGHGGPVGSFYNGSHEDDHQRHMALDLRTKIAAIDNSQERKVINYSMAGLSMNEIAQALGLSKASVAKLRDSAYGKLREGMTGYAEASETDDE